MRHTKLLAAVQALWPKGIPPHDYETLTMMVELVSTVGKAPAAPEPEEPRTFLKKKRRKKGALIAGVMELLKKSGPMTAAEVLRVMGPAVPRARVAHILHDLHNRKQVKREGDRGSYLYRWAA